MSKLDLQDFIGRARQVTVRAELDRRGLWGRAMHGDNGVPCPGCGGRDRFAVNLRKNVWSCRASGSGGDAIALAQHIDGHCDFVRACEAVLGEPAPRREVLSDDQRRELEREAEQRRAREAEKARERDIAARRYREYERQAAHKIWRESLPLAGTMAEAYLTLRGLTAPASARLRYDPTAPLWSGPPDRGGRRIHVGPALVAAIGDNHAISAGSSASGST